MTCSSGSMMPARRSDLALALAACHAAKGARPAVPAVRRAYGGLMADVLHPVYLPFTADQLRGHFAPVHGPGEEDRHLRYYRASIEEARKHGELVRGGEKPT